MSQREKKRKNLERSSKMVIWMAGRSSRNKSLLDRVCRKIVASKTAVAPDQDFLRDEYIDNDEGFDPDELDRYQRGEEI